MALGRMTHSTALLRARMVQDIYDIGHQKDYVFDMRSKNIRSITTPMAFKEMPLFC